MKATITSFQRVEWASFICDFCKKEQPEDSEMIIFSVDYGKLGGSHLYGCLKCGNDSAVVRFEIERRESEFELGENFKR